MNYLPPHPTGLRADQLDAWEQHAADQYGTNERTRPAHPSDVDPGWVAQATRAIAAARKGS